MKISVFWPFFDFGASYRPQIGLKRCEIIPAITLEYALTEKNYKKIIFQNFGFVGESYVKFFRQKISFWL